MSILTGSQASYKAKKGLLSEQMAASFGSPVRLGKPYSNLFRARSNSTVTRLDVSTLNKVISVDARNLIVHAEGMTTFEDLADATLEHGLVPAVVPELATITIGGAIAGGGIESSSFKYGLVHDAITEMEILLADGSLVVATPDNDYRDLFFGLPNTFGTLGYVMSVKMRLMKAKPLVKLDHYRFQKAADFLAAIGKAASEGKWQGRGIDYLDGVVFGPSQFVMTTGHFVDAGPQPSNYRYMNIYYKSLLTKSEDYLTARDYLWRWDPDWFWCSKSFYAQKPMVRAILGKWLLHSKSYWKITRLDQQYKIMERVGKLTGNKRVVEMAIQDVQIPLESAEKYLQFMDENIHIWPIWVCPTIHHHQDQQFPMYKLETGKVYLNFGFWDGVETKFNPKEGHYNKLIEAKVASLGGKKGLYSDSFYTSEQFWELYPKPAYDKLKTTYDPTNRLRNVYDKTVKHS